MLTRDENELLCRVGADTPMGTMLRRYWTPACLSEELPEADGTPIRVRLLGEDLVAFRDSNGSVGVLDEHCPHRGASLVLARSEDCGLRCLYHGWHINVEGRILDMPAEPEGSDYKHRIKQLAYPVREAGGLVWVYMGPAEKQPPFPALEWTALPVENLAVTKFHAEANYIQVIEGTIDSAHAPILHNREVYRGISAPNDLRRPRPVHEKRAHLEPRNTDYGFHYAAIYKTIDDPENDFYVRVVPFVLPYYAGIPPNTFLFAVPIDDDSSWFYLAMYSRSRPVDRTLLLERNGLRLGIDVDANYRKLSTLENGYRQDRAKMQRGESFTGMESLVIQDSAVQETMGPIYDRTKEHLGATDVAVIRMRRLMLDSLQRVQEGGDPIGVDRPINHAKIRSAATTIKAGTPWQSLVPDDVVLAEQPV
jgi:phthalate 4,5-dioxygenase oxygenase subunit